jgi:hypothetical protein
MSKNNLQEKLLEQELQVVPSIIIIKYILFIRNRFALIEHRNYIDAQRNLSVFITSPPSSSIFFGIQARYATENKIKSKSISSPLTGETQIEINHIEYKGDLYHVKSISTMKFFRIELVHL